jgi:hypothetical protein
MDRGRTEADHGGRVGVCQNAVPGHGELGKGTEREPHTMIDWNRKLLTIAAVACLIMLTFTVCLMSVLCPTVAPPVSGGVLVMAIVLVVKSDLGLDDKAKDTVTRHRP